MSRLYFATEDEEVELRGWEYHHLRGLVEDLAMGVLNPGARSNTLAHLINPDHYMSRYVSDGQNRLLWVEAFATALRMDGMGSPLLTWKGQPVSGHHLLLNTAIIAGGDAVKLATRLGSQGNIHAWVDGPDRAWVADMIEVAVSAGVYRTGLRRETVPGLDMVNGREDPERDVTDLEPSGWKDVLGLLRASDKGPVVTHYSVDEGFPDRRLVDMDWEAWEDLPAGEHWRLCMESLRTGAWSKRFSGLRIKPDDWTSFRYGHTLSAYDLFAEDAPDRLDRVAAKGWLK